MLHRIALALAVVSCSSPAPRPAPVAPAPPAPVVVTPPAPPAAPTPPALRLPTTVRPTSNVVVLTIDPASEDFSGSITTAIAVDQPTTVIWLNGDEIEIAKATATIDGATQTAVVTAPKKGYLALSFAAPLARGTGTLAITYRGKMHRSDGEYVVWGSAGPMETDYTLPSLRGFFQANSPRSREHITQKPVEVMRELVKIAPEGGVILDPFMGSGTTGVAAMLEGRRFVGVEMVEHYQQVAERRIREAQGQAVTKGDQGALDFGEPAWPASVHVSRLRCHTDLSTSCPKDPDAHWLRVFPIATKKPPRLRQQSGGGGRHS